MTDMLETLKKVKLAVATRDLIPLQSCFHFYKGRVQGSNGAVCLDAPMDFFEPEDHVTINAVKMMGVVKLCAGKFNYRFTTKQKLAVSKNKFRALIPIFGEGEYHVTEKEEGITIKAEGLLHTLEELRPFVSEDASRPWSRSIMFKNGYAYATNNTVLARLPAPNVAETSVPVSAIDILLDLGMEPATVEVTSRTITFSFPNGMWLQSQLIEAGWPDVEKIIIPSLYEDLPEYFAGAIENMIPFCDDPKFPIITLGEYGVSTSEGATEATIDLGELPESVFRAEPLLMVARKAVGIAFESYPKACYFEGEDGVEGMLIGIKVR